MSESSRRTGLADAEDCVTSRNAVPPRPESDQTSARISVGSAQTTRSPTSWPRPKSTASVRRADARDVEIEGLDRAFSAETGPLEQRLVISHHADGGVSELPSGS